MADLLKKKFGKKIIGQIATLLAQHHYAEKIVALENALKTLGDDIYKWHFSEHLELIKSLPCDWLKSEREIYIKFRDQENRAAYLSLPSFEERDYSGQRTGVMRREYKERVVMELTDCTPIPHYWRNHAIPILPDSEFGKNLEKIKTDLANLQSEQFNFYDEMVKLLGDLGSFKSLYEHSPEVREIVQELEPEAPLLMTPSTA